MTSGSTRISATRSQPVFPLDPTPIAAVPEGGVVATVLDVVVLLPNIEKRGILKRLDAVLAARRVTTCPYKGDSRKSRRRSPGASWRGLERRGQVVRETTRHSRLQLARQIHRHVQNSAFSNVR